jgi:hypothetical protein
VKHELKSRPEFFQASWAGAKTFEIRSAEDRQFRVHDEVVLQEWDPMTEEYTGREIEAFIVYLTDYEQKPGYVVFAIDEIGRREG